jgi:hypothetical protein
MTYSRLNVKGLFERCRDLKYSETNQYIGHPIEVTHNID